MENDWLEANGYKKSSYYDSDDSLSDVVVFQKTFDDYVISIQTITNRYGGRKDIVIFLLDESREVQYPEVKYFATGFDDYAAFEKMVAEEIIPVLKKCKINVKL